MTLFLENITQPTLLVLKQVCERNIKTMSDKAKASATSLRPHFKTHQSIEIAEVFRKQGVDKITVSSLSMAQYFANAGWNDILVAFVFNHREIEKAKQLAAKIKLSLLADSLETIDFIGHNINTEIGLYLKIDTGNHRTGIAPTDLNTLDNLVDCIEKYEHIRFCGFLGHCGHTYSAVNKQEILKIWTDAVDMMQQLKNRYTDRFSSIKISLGDTPGCSLANDFAGIDEIRPGNFVYYDLMQYYKGCCSFEQIAVAVVCPVVSKNASRNEIVLYGGAVHFSKEHILNPVGEKVFGEVAFFNGSHFEPVDNAFLTSLTQEHGIVKCSDVFFEKVSIGDLLMVVPAHSCLTAHQLKENTLYV